MDHEQDIETPEDVPLGRDYEDDFETDAEPLGTEHLRGVPFDTVDKVEARTRASICPRAPAGRCRRPSTCGTWKRT